MPKRTRSPSHSRASEDSDSNIANEDNQSQQSANTTNTMLTRKRRRRTGVLSINEMCNELLEKVKSLKSEDEQVEVYSDLLWKVPSKRSVPEYYDMVKQPIDLAHIQSKVRDDEYESVDQMHNDMLLLTTNTKLFYSEDCEEFAAADQLLKLFEAEKERILNAPPNPSGLSNSIADSASVASSCSRLRRASRRDMEGSESDEYSESRSGSSHNVSESNGSTVGNRRKIGNVYQNYFAYVATHKTENGHKLHETFKHLPSKKSYPQYYEVIKEPIDLCVMANKVECGAYANLDEMHRDFQLMAKNAKTFNEPRSSIYQDAVDLGKIAKKRFNDLEQHSKTGRRIRVTVSGSVDITASFARAKQDDDDSILIEEEQEFEKGEDIRFPIVDPRYPYRRLYDILSSQSTIEPFMRLPSASLYADYYDEIKAPISMLMIRNKINANSYRCLDDLKKDFDLMFENAKMYNIEESEIHNNAIKLQNLVHDVLEEMIRYLSEGNRDLSGFYPNVNSGQGDTSCTDSIINSLINDFTYRDTKSVNKNIKNNEIIRNKTPKQQQTPEEMLKRRLITLYKTITGARLGDRLLCELFMNLPSKEDYPDYYEVIPEPIDLTMIKTRIDNDKYGSHQELADDIRLLLKNAKHYNEEGSQIFNDAVFLENTLKNRVKSLNNQTANALRRTQQQLIDSPSSSSKSPFIRKPNSLPTNNSPRLNSANVRAQIEQRRMRELYLTVKEYRDRHGRNLSTPFMRLPSRQDMPQYYEIIKRPIELLDIGQKLDSGKYSSVDELMDDLICMFVNACHFNEPHSTIYKDALTLQRICLEKKAVLLAEEDILLAEGLAIAQVPQIFGCVRDILTRIFVRLNNYEDEEGRCLSDSFVDIQPPQQESTTTAATTSTTTTTGSASTTTTTTAAAISSVTSTTIESPTSFDQLKRQLDAGCYRRLDRFQEDIFHVLRFMRKNSAVKSQVYEDASELQRIFIQLRNEITDNGRRLSSPAMAYSEQDLDKELASDLELYKKVKTNDDAKEPKTFDGEKIKQDVDEEQSTTAAATILSEEEEFSDERSSPSLAAPYHGLPSVIVRNQTFYLHDFVYICQSNDVNVKETTTTNPAINNNSQYHIAQIVGIESTTATATTPPKVEETTSSSPTTTSTTANESPSSSLITVQWFNRVTETFHMPHRKFLFNEVFLTSKQEKISSERIMGSCHVMWVKEFIKRRPKNVKEENLFVCESRYSIAQKAFKKLKYWRCPGSSTVELEDRPIAMVLRREPSVLAVQGRTLTTTTSTSSSSTTHPSRQHHTTILDIPRDNVILEDKTEGEGIVFYEQVVCANGFSVKLGDFVYLPVQEGKDKLIVRVERIWKIVAQNLMYFSGPSFLRQGEAPELANIQAFYDHEVFLCPASPATHILGAVVGKCHVMTLQDYCLYRPTEYVEDDVYVCESRIQPEDNSIVLLQMPFKTPRFSPKTCVDELYYFPKPMKFLKKPVYDLLQDKMDMSDFLGDACSDHTNTPSNLLAHHHSKTSSKQKGVRKPPTAYNLYSADMRKRLQPHRPDAHFGDLSREVGLMWRSLPDDQKEVYERRAQKIRTDMEMDEKREKGGASAQMMAMPVAMEQKGPVGVVVGPNGPMMMHGTQTVVSTYPQAAQIMQQSPQQQHQQQQGYATFGSPTYTQHQLQQQQQIGQFQPQVQQHGNIDPHHLGIGHHHTQSVAIQPGAIATAQQQQQQQQGIPQGNVMIHHQPTAVYHFAANGQPILSQQQMQPMMRNGLSTTTGVGGGVGPNLAIPSPGPSQMTEFNQTSSSVGANVSAGHFPIAMSAAPVTYVQARPPPPLFVSVPPKPVKLMHSKVYTKYIDTLRHNTQYLSDWPKQLTASKNRQPPNNSLQQHADHVASQFIASDNWKHHGASSVDALWALRDFLLRDSLNIRSKILGYKES